MHKTRNVSYNIPAGDNYETDSISYFSGLHMTDNPLLADQTSAADMLNVYLSSENTLSTRPRLEFTDFALNCKELLSAYKLAEDTILYHYIDLNNNVKLMINNGPDPVDTNGLPLSREKIRAFKKDDKIYILDGNSYYVIKKESNDWYFNRTLDDYTFEYDVKFKSEYDPGVLKDFVKIVKTPTQLIYVDEEDIERYAYNGEWLGMNTRSISFEDFDIPEALLNWLNDNATFTSYKLYSVIDDSDTYIPITKIGRIVNGSKVIVDNDPYNILSNKHRKLLFWENNEKSLYEEQKHSSKLVYNDYIKNREIKKENFTEGAFFNKVVLNSKNGIFIVRSTKNSYDYYMVSSNSIKKINLTDNYAPINISDNGRFLLCKNNTNLRVYDLNYDNSYSEWLNSTYAMGTNQHNFTISNDGTLIHFITYHIIYQVVKVKRNGNSWSTFITDANEGFNNYNDNKIYYNENNNLIWIAANKLRWVDDSMEIVYERDYNRNEIALIPTKFKLSDDGKYLIGRRYNTELVLINVDDKSSNLNYKSITFEKHIKDFDMLNEIIYIIENGKLQYSTLDVFDNFQILYDFENISQDYYFSNKNIMKSTEDEGFILYYYEVSSEPKLLLEFYIKKPIIDYELTDDFNINLTLNNPYNIDLSEFNDLKYVKLIIDDTDYSDPIEAFEHDVTITSGGMTLIVKKENSMLNFNVRNYSSTDEYKTINVTIYGTKQSVIDGIHPKLFTNFYNNYWFAEGNKLYNTTYNDPTYIEEGAESIIGDDTDITGFNLLGDTSLCVYKPNKQFVVSATRSDDNIVLYFTNEMKTNQGNIPYGETLLSSQTGLPLQFNDDGIFVLQIPENINTTESSAISISEKINKKYLAEPDKDLILTHNHLYWTYIMIPSLDKTHIYVLDSRNNGWYYWEIPIRVVGSWERVKKYDILKIDGETVGIYNHDIPWTYTGNGNVITNEDVGEYEIKEYTETVFMDDLGNEYEFKVIDYFDEMIDATEYYDLLSDNNGNTINTEISWMWESQILPLTYSKYNKGYPATNYMKQLSQTGFLFVDSDQEEEYSLFYKFTVYKKHMSDKSDIELPTNTLNYIRSVLVRTRIPKFNFLKITLKNTDDSHKSKLNLISLKLKYKLMEERLS